MQHALSLSPIVRLANEPPFALGPLVVDPARSSVARDDAPPIILEPRVMQVLVALAQAGGTVVGRDELILRAWEGVVVGDAAINRAVARLRRVGEELGGAFTIETVTKVGYRLLVAGADAPDAPDAQAEAPPPLARAAAMPDADPAPGGAAGLSRRALVAGGLAAVAAGAGGLLWWTSTADERRARAQASDLLRRANGITEQRDWWANQQAVALLRRAVAIDPRHAEAWAALALAHSDIFAGSPPSGLERIRADLEESARRALAFDPDNRDARAALALVPHHFRHWAPVRAQLEAALARDPGHRTLNIRYNSLLDDLGLWRVAIPRHERAVARDPVDVVPRLQLARALWGAGRLGAAVAMQEETRQLWPSQDAPWHGQFAMLALSGDPVAALGMGTEPAAYPGRNRHWHALVVQAAQALRLGDPAARTAAVAALRASERGGAYPGHWAAIWLVALGEPAEALGRMERLLLGPPFDPARPGVPHPLVARSTAPLFLPPMRPLWGEPRFAALLKAVGLEDYWARAGIVPDFRRADLAAR